MKKMIFILTLCSIVYAKSIIGIGYSTHIHESRGEALEDIAQQIAVDIKTQFNSTTLSTEKDFISKKEHLVNIISNLPILGASYTTSNNQTQATLSSEKSLRLYENHLKSLAVQIQTLHEGTQKETNTAIQYEMYGLLGALIENFEKHKLVAEFLESKQIPTLSITAPDIKTKILALSKNIDSIELAAIFLSAKIEENLVYVFPAKVSTAQEITPFAKVLKEQLSQKIASVMQPNEAHFYLNGNYEILDDGLFISYALSDKGNNILKKNSVFLQKSALKNLVYEPKNITFDEEVANSEIVNRGLKIELSFKDIGSKDVLLFDKQNVELVAKSNQIAHFYIIGHTFNDSDKYSYLVELQPDAIGKERFLYKIGASMINTPLSLGEFEISAPFGYEVLQMYASNQSMLDDVPSCKIHESGLCIISDNPIQVVTKTRAIMRPKNNEAKVLKSETTLSYTTMPK